MRESDNHMQLVQEICKWIEANSPNKDQLSILTDSPLTERHKLPPKVGCFSPDVYAKDLSSGVIIIGEAKTKNDLDTAHSRRQFDAFLRYLSNHKNSTLIVATPWHMVNRAKSLIRCLQRKKQAKNVKVKVLDLLPG